jgi:hypothetical protein
METVNCWYHNNIIIIKPEYVDISNIDYKSDDFTRVMFSDYEGIVANIEKYNIKIDYNSYASVYDYNREQRYIGSRFNNSLDILPSYLTHILLNNKFNQQVDNLPKTLIFITFGNYFNQIVDNLPCGLECIIFGREFNQIIDKLPNSLIYIYFSVDFNQPLDNLPCSLVKIEFPPFSKFQKTLNNLPNSIKTIRIGKDYHNIITQPINILYY